MRNFIFIFSILLSTNLLAKVPSTKYFDLAFTDVRETGGQNGFTYRLGIEISDNVYFDTSRYNLSGSSYDGSPELDVKNYALGVKFDLNNSTFFYIDYSNLKLTDEDNLSDKGNVQAAGFRGSIAKDYEWQIEYNRTEIDDSDEALTGSLIGFHYILTKGASVFVEKVDWLEADIATIGFRFSF